ncbi:MAG TPA: thiamine-phosphate kinase [Syntrophorhabdaceae bacterium]|nr:thiamine-phosphate kinase [Syntrophorhabdaceae bacterium]
MDIMDVKENHLIKLIKRFEKKSTDIIRGIGDDGAVVKLKEGKYVFTQDGLIEHIHFEFSFTKPYYIGKKAIYVNVSDILSMGALPLYFLVTIGIPEKLTSTEIMDVYRGISAAAREFHLIMLGGDTIATNSDFLIDVSMIGILKTNKYLGRDGAKEGDFIALTGHIGEGAYGLKVLKDGVGKEKKTLNRYIKRYINPRPPFELWNELIKTDVINAMIDISDGLIIDLERMMDESKKSAKIFMERLPIPNILKRLSLEELALLGGEDFQLLFTFPKEKLSVIENIKRKGYVISIIGEVKKGRGVKLYENGKKKEILKKGYEHFNVEKL